MATRGGIHTLKGVCYEVLGVLYEMPGLLDGRLKTLRYQPASSALSSDQPPSKVFADDYAFEDKDGLKHYCQAKRNARDASWTVNRLLREGVIGQFWEQHKAVPGCHLVFVSNVPAPGLQDLAERSRESVSSAELTGGLPVALKEEMDRIVETLEISPEGCWELLKATEHRLLTEKQIDEYIANYACNRYSDTDKFALTLKDLVERSAGRLLTGKVIVQYLERKGLFRLPISLPSDIQTVLHQSSALLRQYKSHILGVHIPREETSELVRWIKTTENGSVAFLLDVAGSGKSVIMHDLLEELEKQRIPTLGIKADLLGDVVGPSDLQDALGLPARPEALLAGAARESKAILLIDQLDALSLTFARNQSCLDTVIGLIARASTIPRVRVVVSCRSFDRKFDPKLRQIQSGKEFRIAPLVGEQVQLVLDRLGLRWDGLNPREQQILARPHHLDLFARVQSISRQPHEKRPLLSSVQDLYNGLWDAVILQPRSSSVIGRELQTAIYRLVNAIEEHQVLGQDVSLLDDLPKARHYLQSEGILSRERNLLTFFHQSFFDYCFARRFVQESGSLAEVVRRGDQGFFVRPQIVQTLNYLRETDPTRYLRELVSLMDSRSRSEWMRKLTMHPGVFRRMARAVLECIWGRPVRYHLRRLVFEWFGQRTELAEEEKALGLACLRRAADRRLILGGARGNTEWFDVLQTSLARLCELSDNVVDEEIVPFLRFAEDDRANQVFGLLFPRLGISERWDSRVIWCLNFCGAWNSPEAEKCLLWLCDHGRNPSDSLDLALHKVAKGNPQVACRALGRILNRLHAEWQQTQRPPDATECREMRVSGDSQKTKEQFIDYMERSSSFDHHAGKLLPRAMYWIDDVVEQATNRCPARFLDTVLPWLEKVLPDLTWNSHSEDWLRDEVFSLGFEDRPRDPNSTIIWGVRRAFTRLSERDSKCFLACVRRLEKSRYLVFHQILTEVLAEGAERYALLACDYLLRDRLRFRIGDLASRTVFSRELVGAIFPHLTPPKRAELEKAILSYCPDLEMRAESRPFRGLNQLDLLWDIPSKLLTSEGRKRKGELKRKFVRYAPSRRQTMEISAVGPPIPEPRTKILSDDAWLDGMHHFDDDTSREKGRRERLRGGVEELSRAFEKVVQGDPDRFALLGDCFDERISSQYLRSLLIGLGKSNVKASVVFRLCQDFYRIRPDDTIVQAAVCDAVRKRIKDSVPDEIIEIVKLIALTSPDPDHEEWQKKSLNGQYYYDGDPFKYGINTARGNAVRVYIHCMLEKPMPNTESLLDSLEEIAADSSSAVRSCAIEFLPYLLRFEAIRVVKIFDACVENRPEILACQVSHNFIYYALSHHGAEMLQNILLLTKNGKEGVRESAGRLATLGFLLGIPGYGVLYRQCLGGDPVLRRGVARILAKNVDRSQLLKKCVGGLGRLCQDSDKDVRRAVSRAFGHFPPPSPEVERFIVKYLRSRAVTDPVEDVVEYAEKTHLANQELALRIAERIQSALGRSVADVRREEALIDDHLVRLAVSIRTHATDTGLKARALDVFERALDIGSPSAAEALRAAER